MTIVNEQGTDKNKWIWIGLGAAVLFCCCAALVAFFVVRQAGQKLQEGMDPQEASKAAHEIVDYELPRGYQEQAAMDVIFYSFVIIAPKAPEVGEPLIMFAQFQSGVDQQQVEERLRQSFEQQSGSRGRDMELVEVKKMNIRGEETEVAIYEGTDESGNSMRQLITSFPGKNGTAMLMITGYTQKWNQQMVDDFIQSIR